jgi:opacity protein-like surface antigen
MFFKSLFATVLTSSLLTSSVFAQESPAQTDVSQINGQLVPVGDHNQYRLSFPRWNLSVNPVGWVLGLYGARGSYALHQNVAVAVDVNYFNAVDGDDHGFEGSLGVPIYFRRAYQGAFLEPGVMFRRVKDAAMAAENEVGPQVLVGWHWMWDSGLNVSAALGAGRNFGSNSDDNPLFVNGYLRFGYAF